MTSDPSLTQQERTNAREVTSAEHLTTAIESLRWFTTAPHTIDHLVAVQRRVLATRARMDGAVSAAEERERLDELGTPPHADPVGESVANGHRLPSGRGAGGPIHAGTSQPASPPPDPDETIPQVDGALALIREKAIELETWCCENPSRYRDSSDRVFLLNQAQVALSAARRTVNDMVRALDGDDAIHVLFLVRVIRETTEWLVVWARGLPEREPGTVPQEVRQRRQLAECSHCKQWRSGTIAGDNGLCAQCDNFKRNHPGAESTEAIVRRWDYGKGATPAQIIEAKAAARSKKKRAS